MITPASIADNTMNGEVLADFSKRRKVIERVFSFLTNLGAERSKSRSAIAFQVKLEMIISTYSLIFKSAKTIQSQTLKYSIRYQIMAK